jgi:branched-subunit amino acid permease
MQKDIAKGKMGWNMAILSTMVISYLLSLTGFATISHILGVILEYIYPALIILAITSILHKYIGFKPVKQSFWVGVLVTIMYKLV